MRASIVAIAMSYASMNCCLAQERAGATDTELRAAYCIGVATVQLEEHARLMQGVKAGIELEIADDIRNILTERRDRMRDYLTSKGYLNGRDVSEIRSALLRGPADQKRCAVENNDPVIAACEHRCGEIKTLEDGERCDVRCGADACVRVKRCLQQFLPF
jgi:hypothetical protein